MNFLKRKRWGNANGNINIYSDFKNSDIAKIISEKKIQSLQFNEFRNPKLQTWQTLNELFRQFPEIGLRLLWYDTLDFSFYKEIPDVRSFTIASYNTRDFTPLLSNPGLHHLGIEETKSTAVDLSFIKEFKELSSLYIDGMKKGLENVRHLPELKKLTFRGVKMGSVDFLENMGGLIELRLLYGSYKNLDSMEGLHSLKSLELSRVRQIPDFKFLTKLTSLECFELEGMARMESIPNLTNLKKLKRIEIHNNLRLEDIRSVADIPNLAALNMTFAENSKASSRKELIGQAVQILMASKSIKYTNIMHWTDEKTTETLKEKGIVPWRWDVQL